MTYIMHYGTQLLSGLRELSYMHRVSASELISIGSEHISPWTQPFDVDELLKFHILSRESINAFLGDLDVDALNGPFDPGMPLKRISYGQHPKMPISPEFPTGAKNWYKRFLECYRGVICLGSLKANIEQMILGQLWAVESLLPSHPSNNMLSIAMSMSHSGPFYFPSLSLVNIRSIPSRTYFNEPSNFSRCPL